MSSLTSWTSPDGKIKKMVLVEGNWGAKPAEWSECQIKISNCDLMEQFNRNVVIVGDNDGDLGRILDICLINMNEGETAEFTILEPNISFTINLLKVTHNGWIYQWNVRKKFEITQSHKDRGVQLFKENQMKDAACRFSKALKILSSIPIDVENPPKEIDGVQLIDINNMKGNLYNNLASIHLKREAWFLVIDCCKKVFTFEEDNVKAHYKIGVAYMKDRNFEQAEKSFETVLKFEPENKAAVEQLKCVREEIKQSNVKFNMLVKKMFN